jgi:hypothetical protein
MKLSGTHTAETAPHGRLRSCGQLLIAELSWKVVAEPRRTATQENGDSTEQPGDPALGW